MNRAERRRLQKQARKQGKTAAAEYLTPAAQQELGRALEHHRAGRLAQAESGYGQVLRENPGHPGVLHLMGVIAQQQGDGEAAVDLIAKALSVKPDFFEAHNNLGTALKQLGRADEAVASYRKAIAIKPDYAEAHYNLGNALHQQGKLDEAEASFRQALVIDPGYVTAYNNLGNLLKVQGRPEEAVASCRKAVEIRPDFAEAHNNLGTLLLDMGDPVEAAACFSRALALTPNFAEARNNLGNALTARGRLEEAAASYREALAIIPDYAEALFNLGNVQGKQGHLEDASENLERAIACKPDYLDARINLGNLLGELRRFDAAQAAYGGAIALDPNAAEAHTNLGLLQLLSGNFRDGWVNYAWRWRLRDAALRPRAYAKPLWEGASLEGKTVFIYPEQGFGDAIQFARYLPLVAARAGRVVFEAPDNLRRLLECGGFTGALVGAGDAPPGFDCHAALLELPRLFNTNADTIPECGDIFAVPCDLVDTWAARIGNGAKIRVGVAWAGRPTHTNDRNRSLAAELLRPLAEVPGVSLFSLQLGRDSEARAVFGEAVTDLADDLGDFADTAAAMMNLDLVVAVDTAVAHLAGTLGRPVWTLLPYTPDWRWQLDRDDSPWYPTMRLFRQSAPGDWQGVVQRLVEALGSFRRPISSS